MKRDIIVIDEEKCNGCGLCVPGCHEGALQIIDGKARLISDLFCDGLGACIGHCPEGALTIEEREAEPYDEKKVMEGMLDKGDNTILAHLRHLKEHGEHGFLNEALAFLSDKGYKLDTSEFVNNAENTKEMVAELFGGGKHLHKHSSGASGGCPGAMAREFTRTPGRHEVSDDAAIPSELKQWPVQLHLVNPQANYFQGADVALAADCAAFAVGDFHRRYLKGKTLAIACPKLDSNPESYVAKLTTMIDDSGINTLTIIRMEVPCCGGLVHIAKAASRNAARKIPLKEIVIGVQGNTLSEEWI